VLRYLNTSKENKTNISDKKKGLIILELGFMTEAKRREEDSGLLDTGNPDVTSIIVSA
jgi:hypothetical protein